MNSFVLLLIVVKSIFSQSIHLRIYDNIAEITKPISNCDLSLSFSQQEWYDIRSDSIRLIGKCLHVRSQTIAFNQTSLNGQKILIKRDLNNQTYTEAIMIDEARNLVQDLVDNTFYVISSDRIRYFMNPFARNYTVNFDAQFFSSEQLYVRYLQKNIKWSVRYDLLLEHNDTDAQLHAYADLQNLGNSVFKIDSTELISGDIEIQSSSSTGNGGSLFGLQNQQASDNTGFADVSAPPSSPPPTVSDSQELVGVYIYTINQTFDLNPQSNFILSMFRPKIDIERYGLIEKYFFSRDNHGNAQRGYRFRAEETFLPAGQVFIRESDRLVGEISWQDLAANETNEFSIGEDPDLQYIESIQFESRRVIRPTNTNFYGHNFTISTYTIQLRLINNKDRPINFEYRLRFYSQDYLRLIENTKDNLLDLDGDSLFGIFKLNANDEQEYTFKFEN